MRWLSGLAWEMPRTLSGRSKACGARICRLPSDNVVYPWFALVGMPSMGSATATRWRDKPGGRMPALHGNPESIRDTTLLVGFGRFVSDKGELSMVQS